MKITKNFKCYYNSYNCITNENADMTALFHSVIPVFDLLLEQWCDKMKVLTNKLRRDCEHTWQQMKS